MRFKVDENLPVDVADLLHQQHDDAMTILEQRMAGLPDEVVAQVCQQECRVLHYARPRFCGYSPLPARKLCGHYRAAPSESRHFGGFAVDAASVAIVGSGTVDRRVVDRGRATGAHSRWRFPP